MLISTVAHTFWYINLREDGSVMNRSILIKKKWGARDIVKGVSLNTDWYSYEYSAYSDGFE